MVTPKQVAQSLRNTQMEPTLRICCYVKKEFLKFTQKKLIIEFSKNEIFC